MLHPKRKIRPFNWSRRLVQLAVQAAAIPSHNELTLAEHQLAELVARVVMRGSDQPLHQAIAQLDRQHHHEAADLVEFWADEAATEIGVEMDGTNKTSGIATAFLIPVVLVTEAPHAVPLTIPTDITLNQIVTTLQRHGLVGPDARVIVFPGLYREDDLPQSWASRRQWLEETVAQANKRSDATHRPEFEPPLLVCGDTGVTLRFLAGVVATADEDDAPGLMMVGYNTDEDALLQDAGQAAIGQRISEWRDDFVAAMAPMMKLTSIVAGLPDVWANALEFGRTLLNHVALDTLVRTWLDRDGLDAREVIASIEWNDEDDAWRVTLRTESTASASWRWSAAVDPQDELTAIMENLRDWGVGRMAIDERRL